MKTLIHEGRKRNCNNDPAAEIRPMNLNSLFVDVLMLQMRYVTECCEFSLAASDSGTLNLNLKNAKRAYGAALLIAGHLSFATQDVRAFEFSSIRLEKVIAELEDRYLRKKVKREAKLIKQGLPRRPTDVQAWGA